MNDFMIKLEKIISSGDQTINDKVFGVNYLEQLKYLLISDLKNLNENDLEKLNKALKNTNSLKNQYENLHRIIYFSINLYKDSYSKIKSLYDNDTLSIVIDGYKTISFFDKKSEKNNITLSVLKNMGLVITQNSIITEKIASDSIILDIKSEKKTNDIIN